MTPFHIQAQWAEFTRLKQVIGEVYSTSSRALWFFDIGIGYARVPVLLSSVGTWEKVSRYVGIDNSQHCVTQSKRIITSRKIAEKVEVVKSDALDISKEQGESFRHGKYDLVVCTYFTAGDFKPDRIELDTDKNGHIVDYDVGLLEPNQNFVAVFKGAFDLVREGGRIILGSIYLDNELARKRQEELYTKCGMTVITSKKDQFAATKEGFWSERFTEEKIYDYLSWIPSSKIELISLDDYSFAVMVVITK
jgi:hypothetical protein